MTFRTTFEDPDPDEHFTRPCSRCGRNTCVLGFYKQGDETDICWRCAGRYATGCDCEELAESEGWEHE